jgi:hypothetical protein
VAELQTKSYSSLIGLLRKPFENGCKEEVTI